MKNLADNINIAVDGPSGAGKSTVAKIIAEKLGIVYLDTGAMYRGLAYAAIKQNVNINDTKDVERFLSSVDMKIETGDIQQIYVNGENVTPFIREHYVSKAASDISALPAVRTKMVDLQREIAKGRSVILDGRDIGTVVLPNAQFKFFITAAPDERAKRRYIQLQEKGGSIPTYDKILSDILERDYNDSHRATSPLVKADDALLIDTTTMSIDEVVHFVLDLIGDYNG